MTAENRPKLEVVEKDETTTTSETQQTEKKEEKQPFYKSKWFTKVKESGWFAAKVLATVIVANEAVKFIGKKFDFVDFNLTNTSDKKAATLTATPKVTERGLAI